MNRSTRECSFCGAPLDRSPKTLLQDLLCADCIEQYEGFDDADVTDDRCTRCGKPLAECACYDDAAARLGVAIVARAIR